jgi:hypothetical protein
MGACSDKEKAADLPASQDGQNQASGALTTAYLECLLQHSFAPTYRQLIVDISRILKRLGTDQHVQLASSYPLNLDAVFEPMPVR